MINCNRDFSVFRKHPFNFRCFNSLLESLFSISRREWSICLTNIKKLWASYIEDVNLTERNPIFPLSSFSHRDSKLQPWRDTRRLWRKGDVIGVDAVKGRSRRGNKNACVCVWVRTCPNVTLGPWGMLRGPQPLFPHDFSKTPRRDKKSKTIILLTVGSLSQLIS